MTKTAEALTAARHAHRQGRDAMKRGLPVQARAAFLVALNARLSARELDPDYADPAWGEDLTSLHSRKEFDRDLGRRLHVAEGEREPEGYDAPSRQTGVSLRARDLELETYYRQQLGSDPNARADTDPSDLLAVVKTPDAWVTTSAGVDRFNADGTIVKCQHAMQYLNESYRRCVGCGEQQALQPTMKPEETQAFKQLQREASKAKGGRR